MPFRAGCRPQNGPWESRTSKPLQSPLTVLSLRSTSGDRSQSSSRIRALGRPRMYTQNQLRTTASRLRAPMRKNM